MAPPKRKSQASFVERHSLWTAAQAKAAAGVERAIKSQKLELMRFSFADQHGVFDRGHAFAAFARPRRYAGLERGGRHSAL